MAEVTMSLEEYLQLVERDEKITAERRGRFADSKPKRKGKKDPKMSKALKKANEWGRTKSGKLRKGVSQGDIMRKAHQLRRKM